MLKKPEQFLEIVSHQLKPLPGLTGMCAGFELEEWRKKAFADHLIEWLPEFALKWSEIQSLSSANAVPLIRKAAMSVFTSDKYKRRGEFGELLLHVAIRQVFDSVPAISKIYYKDSPNDTVKGFDAVHVVDSEESLELWLGEAKFYENISQAIRDVVEELEKHTQKDYLRTEFALITNKLDQNWPHYDKLKQLLHPNTSLDKIFDRVCVPILLTYNSPAVRKHSAMTKAYLQEIKQELAKCYRDFVSAGLPPKLKIHLFLIPMKNKVELVTELIDRLKACQTI